MEGYGPDTYGERIAEVYDELFHPPTLPEDTVEFLAGLAACGPVLELAIGTGRIALPLAEGPKDIIDGPGRSVGRHQVLHEAGGDCRCAGTEGAG
jgi:hypothetical protein